MRSVHKGSLQFSLVNAAVKLYTATEDHNVSFRQHHGGTCLGHVGVKRVCEDCGGVVAWGDMVKGIERDGNLVVLTDAELKELDDEQGPAIDVLQFVHRDEVDPIYFDQTYYLDADKGGEKNYALIRRVLGESDKVGVVRFTMRQRTRMGVLRVVRDVNGGEDVLAIHTMVWHDEIRSTQSLVGARKKVELTPKEIKLAHAVLDSMSGDAWNPAEHVDNRAQRVADLVTAKANGTALDAIESDDDDAGAADVSDLLAKLEASLAKNTTKAKGKKKSA